MSWTPLTPEFAKAAFGFNVVGHLTGTMGLGVASRNTVQALHAAGFRLSLGDLELGDGRSGEDRSCMGLGETADRPDPFAVNLFHCNPPELAGVLARGTHEVASRFNVCVPFWELTRLPTHWIPVLAAMDAILAPSRFILDVLQEALPGALCLHVPHAALVPERVAPGRERWGFAAEETVFVSAFDLSSDLRRKNPQAAVDAFLAAFPKPGRERLVVKVNATPQARQAYRADWERLTERVAAHPRIQLVDARLAYGEILGLYASADVFVSLHRSEGLGLGLMEAMSYGTPVLATGYSGSMDFTTPENAGLVGFQPVPVEAGHPAYAADGLAGAATWAEPDLGEAAAWMRRLAADPGLRRQLGAQARLDMAARRKAFLACGPWRTLQARVVDPEDELWRRHLARVKGFAEL